MECVLCYDVRAFILPKLPDRSLKCSTHASFRILGRCSLKARFTHKLIKDTLSCGSGIHFRRSCCPFVRAIESSSPEWVSLNQWLFSIEPRRLTSTPVFWHNRKCRVRVSCDLITPSTVDTIRFSNTTLTAHNWQLPTCAERDVIQPGDLAVKLQRYALSLHCGTIDAVGWWVNALDLQSEVLNWYLDAFGENYNVRSDELLGTWTGKLRVVYQATSWFHHIVKGLNDQLLDESFHNATASQSLCCNVVLLMSKRTSWASPSQSQGFSCEFMIIPDKY